MFAILYYEIALVDGDIDSGEKPIVQQFEQKKKIPATECFWNTNVVSVLILFVLREIYEWIGLE